MVVRVPVFGAPLVIVVTLLVDMISILLFKFVVDGNVFDTTEEGVGADMN